MAPCHECGSSCACWACPCCLNRPGRQSSQQRLSVIGALHVNLSPRRKYSHPLVAWARHVHRRLSGCVQAGCWTVVVGSWLSSRRLCHTYHFRTLRLASFRELCMDAQCLQPATGSATENLVCSQRTPAPVRLPCELLHRPASCILTYCTGRAQQHLLLSAGNARRTGK